MTTRRLSYGTKMLLNKEKKEKERFWKIDTPSKSTFIDCFARRKMVRIPTGALKIKKKRKKRF